MDSDESRFWGRKKGRENLRRVLIDWVVLAVWKTGEDGSGLVPFVVS